ncbi:MAG TPA: glycoside hydrolase family 130 protein [Candidatus Dormibacteraeota bacterium]|nr:glycoside hydrolase family 130 protein [Candidatus Dormibacteraeota bacterium]
MRCEGDLAERFTGNPILSPADVPPSRPGLEVAGVLNPGAFRWRGRTWLLLRVAERAVADAGTLTAPILDPETPGGLRILRVAKDDPHLGEREPRGFRWRGRWYLTTLSHLRLASSEDGRRFRVEPRPILEGRGPLERFGVEDGRVTELDGEFHLTYTAVSPDGFGVGLVTTSDWASFRRRGMILPPPNKDCVLFPERVDGEHLILHRPVSAGLGGLSMWLARSPDLVHWGGHQCLVRPRPGTWDEAKVGAGAPPVRISEGWLEIYHGADRDDRYCLGAVLLDARDPSRVLARSRDPIVAPLAEYERQGFYRNVVFATGAFLDGDRLTLYYGAADEHVCAAEVSVAAVLNGLES